MFVGQDPIFRLSLVLDWTTIAVLKTLTKLNLSCGTWSWMFTWAGVAGNDLSMAYERARVTMDDPLPSPVHYKVMLLPDFFFFPHPPTIKLVYTWSSLHLSALPSSFQSILKKTVTMHQAPSAVYHYTDSGGSSDVPPSKVGAIFQAAKKDLLGIIQLQVSGWDHTQRVLHA